jgi:hypothetical protein
MARGGVSHHLLIYQLWYQRQHKLHLTVIPIESNVRWSRPSGSSGAFGVRRPRKVSRDRWEDIETESAERFGRPQGSVGAACVHCGTFL